MRSLQFFATVVAFVAIYIVDDTNGQVLSALAPQADYCTVDPNHTACKYRTTNQSGKCGTIAKRELTATQRQQVLDAHNMYRRKVAKGQQSPQPGSSNMVKLTWDDEAAAISQVWVDQCFGLQHDTKRHTVKGGRVYNGQNMFAGSAAAGDFNTTRAVQLWFDEVKAFPSSGVGSFVFSSGTGHYTQVVWAETFSIGCGFIRFGGKDIFACNYKPGGNMMNKPVYKTGAVCTACPATHPRCEDGLCTM